MTRILRRPLGALAALMLLPLSGCVELPGAGSAPPRLYMPMATDAFPQDLPKVGWQLLVEVPVAPAGLSTARILLQDSPLELRYYERANWTDLTPRMIQTLIVHSFENSGRIVGIGREAVGLRSDFVLKTELRDFQAEYPQRLPDGADSLSPSDPAPTARVRIDAKLVALPQREIVASETFESTAPAARNTMSEIVAAFDEALGRTLRKIVVWTLRKGEANERKKAR